MTFSVLSRAGFLGFIVACFVDDLFRSSPGRVPGFLRHVTAVAVFLHPALHEGRVGGVAG